MKRFKKELSLLLVAALVVSSLVLGFGQLQASAISQATGQTSSYRLVVTTAGQDCNGTGTANNLTITINYTDSTTYTSDTFAGEAASPGSSSSNPFEAGNTDTMTIYSAPAKPISSISFNSMGSDRWKINSAYIEYLYDGMAAWAQIASMGGMDNASGVHGFTYPSTYSLNTSLLNKTLTFNANGGSGGTQIYSEQGATLPGSNIPTVLRTGYTFNGWSPSLPTAGPSINTTYTAQWTVNSYTITWAPNGGKIDLVDGGGTNSCNYGVTPTPISAGTITGYNFTGWSPGIVDCTGPATYTAQWAPNQYYIKYNKNTGSGTEGTVNQTYDQAQNLKSATYFTKTGWHFMRWDTKADGSGDSYSAEQSVINLTATADDIINLYAIWEANNYTVSYDPNPGAGTTEVIGSTAPSSHVYDTFSPLSTPGFSRGGYVFAGWAYAPDSINPEFYYSGEPITVDQLTTSGNIVIYAIWTPRITNVAYNNGGGVGAMATTACLFDTPNNLRTNTFTKAGYTFNGWNTALNGSGTSYTNGQSVVNLQLTSGTYTIYAQWLPINYTIAYDVNTTTGNSGSTASSSHTYDVYNTLTPNGFSKVGNNFIGWNTQADGLGTSYNDTESVKNITTTNGATVTFFAVWSAKSDIIITFDATTGGSGGSSGTRVFGTTLSAPEVTKTGHTLGTTQYPLGWDPMVPATVPAMDTTYTAQWTINQYTVSFNSDGGSAVGSITQDYDTAVTTPAAPTKTGYTFAGWVPACPSTMPANNTNCVAQWTANIYTVNYNGNTFTGGSTASSSHTFNIAKLLTLNGFTKIGYSFAGWNTKADGTGISYTDGQSVINLSAINGASFMLYAQWTINPYTITFDANGGSVSQTSSTVTYGSTYAAGTGGFPTPTRTGYTFGGWYTSTGGAGTQIYNSTTVTITAEQTLYAKWSVKIVNQVIFNPDGGTVSPTSSAVTNNSTYGEGTGGFPTPTRTGYIFGGWYTSTSGTGTQILSTTTVSITSSQMLYAKWTIAYIVSYNGNGSTGGSTASSSHTYDVANALTTNGFTKTGYAFAGWAISADDASVYTDGQSVSNLSATNGAIVTLYAKWVVNQYTITFNANGGTGGTSSSINYGTTLTAPANPVRAGYTFLGWLPAVPTVMPAENIACVAQWTIVSTEPVLVPGDGSTTVIDDTKQYIYGLTEGISQADFESSLVGVTGNGRLDITTIDGNIGTGTRVDLIDNATDEVVKTYYIVIYGDINGDGIVGSTDADIINNYENFAVEWNPETQPYLFTASDLNGDGNSEAVDADMVNNVENFNMWIDQATGLAYEY